MAPSLVVVLTAIFLPFLGVVAMPLVRPFLGARTGYVGAAVALASFGLVASQAGRHGTVAASWIPSLEVALRVTVDGWSLLFALLASGMGVLVFGYSARYMVGVHDLARYYAVLLAFMGSILGVAFAADLVVLFVFWELTSLTSFLLIGHHTDDADSRYSARMAMLVTVGGGLFLLVGIAVVAVVAAGTLPGSPFDLAAMLANDEAMRTALRDADLFVPAMALFGVAAAAKSAQVPLHFWLPNAMVAPTPVSAFLHSATMVKVGVYFLGRLRPLFVGTEWTVAFATLGLVTMLVGAVLAVAAADVKELLAYSTASHLGLMVAGFGFASAAGAEAGAFHLLNHALFKAALFLVAGIVAHEAGTRHLANLGGLWRDLPVTAAISGVAALSMAGIPPLNGFYSKELLFEAAYELAHEAGGVAWVYPSVAVLASVFTVLYSLRFLAMFVGDRRTPVEEVHRPPLAMVGPPAVLVALAAVVSVAPQLAVDAIVGQAVTATAVGSPHLHVGLPTHVSGPVVMSALAIVGGVGAYPVVDRVAAAVVTVVRSPLPVEPSRWYDRLLAGTESASAWVGPAIHTGRLRTYVTWVVGVASALVLLGYASTASLPATLETAVPPAVAVVLLVAVVAGLALTATPSHVAGVLTLSILGFMLAIFYILASAPDLALTQLVVETLVLVLFLLVLEKLPSFYGEARRTVVARDATLSVFVGTAAFASVLLAARGPDAGPTDLAAYYTQQAVPGGGGTNVVNVILVDFRGFDTMGELLVVSVAAVAVLVLVTMRNRGEVP
jgi:multicomponent Na+:H+ antiporter subunit A